MKSMMMLTTESMMQLMDTQPRVSIISSLIVLFVLFLLLLILWVRSLRNKAAQDIEERLAGERIVMRDGANYFGQESKGMGQVRGNGNLILTERMILFRMLAPSRWIEIPIERVQGVDQVSNFLGKGYGGMILVVNYVSDEGEYDSIGWAVRDVDGWMGEINSVRERTKF